jgi:hypothetical protein
MAPIIPYSANLAVSDIANLASCVVMEFTRNPEEPPHHAQIVDTQGNLVNSAAMLPQFRPIFTTGARIIRLLSRAGFTCG